MNKNVVINRVIVTSRSLAIIIMLALFSIFFGDSVKASPAPAGLNLSWTLASPEIFSSDLVKDLPDSACQHTPILREIAGTGEISPVCAFEGDKVIFGLSISTRAFRPLVSFSNDTKMHRIYGICGIEHDNCVYLPETDTLVTKQYLLNSTVRSLVVYKNFASRLMRQINASNFAVEYTFDTSNPDYIFSDANGYPWPIGGFGASADGKWLAVEFRQRGIGLLNLETMEMKRISSAFYYYDRGFNPVTEIAVSNGGRTIAVMGNNAGMYIYENTDGCGDLASDEKMWAVSPIINVCKTSPLKYFDYVYAGYPSFSEDGYELSFYKSSRIDGYSKLLLRVSGYENIKLEYLAMGDSFSSGEGEIDDQYYIEGTNDEYEKCHVSTRSYPFLIAEYSGLNLDLVKSVACSGATTKDVIGNDYNYLGQGERLGVNGLDMDSGDIATYQSQSKITFHQGVSHQSSFAKIYQPKIITIGIGGNDIGMIDKLKSCVSPGTCSWVSDPKKREQFAVEIKNIYDDYVNTYQELHNASPASKIYVVGYPRPVDKDGTCGALTGLLLDNSERAFMTEAITYLNQVIKAAADKVGVGYIDIQESYGQHTLCGNETTSAFNSIMLGDDFGLSGQASWVKFIGNESFHPNPYGHQLAANYIFESIGDISDHNYCTDGSTACSKYITVPEPSSYWIPAGYHNYPLIKIDEFIYDRSGSADILQKSIVLPDFYLSPNSSVEIEINSVPVSLGVFNADNLGALNVDVSLPKDIEEGFHTVYIYGTSYSGERIDLYQVIKFQKETEVVQIEEQQVNNIDDSFIVTNNTNLTGTVNSLVAKVDMNQLRKNTELSNNEKVSPVNKGELGQQSDMSDIGVLGESTNLKSDEVIIDSSHGNSRVGVYTVVFITILIISIIIMIFLVNRNKYTN